jgi:hypothetical protein
MLQGCTAGCNLLSKLPAQMLRSGLPGRSSDICSLLQTTCKTIAKSLSADFAHWSMQQWTTHAFCHIVLDVYT